jgi:hypothetical protein
VHTSEQTITTLTDDLNNANIKITEQATEIEQLKATAVDTAEAPAEVLLTVGLTVGHFNFIYLNLQVHLFEHDYSTLRICG